MKKFFIYSFVIIISLLLTVVGLLYADIWDIDPPDVSDLEIEYVQVPPEDNAFTYIKQAAEMYYEPEPEEGVSEDEFYDHFYEVVEGRKRDPDLFDDYISKNQETLILIKQALNCSNYQSKKLLSAGNSIDFENSFSISEAMTASHLLEHRFHYQLRKKLYRDAFESICDIYELGELLLKMENPCSIDIIASTALMKLSSAKVFDEVAFMTNKELTDYMRNLINTRSLNKAFSNAVKFDYCHMEYYVHNYFEVADALRKSENLMMDAPPLYGERFGWFFQPNRTRENLAKICRAAISDFNNLIYKSTSVTVNPCKPVNLEEKIPEWGKNYVGDLLELMYGNHDTLLIKKFAGQAQLISTKVAISCELYRRKHGELPESLNVLVPEFLESVPNDPFDGKPLRYNKEKKIIYSVGENLIDSGGLGERELENLDRVEKRKAENIKDIVLYLAPKETE